GVGVGLAPGALDRIAASWRRLAFPTGEPDPRRPEHVVDVGGDSVEVRLDWPGEILRRHPVDRCQNLVVRPLVVRDELAQLVAVRHGHPYHILGIRSPAASRCSRGLTPDYRLFWRFTGSDCARVHSRSSPSMLATHLTAGRWGVSASAWRILHPAR